MGRLRRRVKVGYGVVEIGTSAVEIMLQLFLLEFYTSVVGLKPVWAGLALGVAVLWDAVTDPAMGVISDHTRSRWGKRCPYIAAAGFALPAAFVMLFTAPGLETQAEKFAYLLFFYMLTNTAMTMSSVPHAALAGELSFDRNERTELFGWRLLSRNGGGLLGTLLPGLAISNYDDFGTARMVAADGVAVAAIVFSMITVWFVRAYDYSSGSPRGSLLYDLRRLLGGIISVATNPIFIPLLLAYIFATIGRTMNAVLALYYYKVRLELTEQETIFGVLGVFIVTLSISILAWVRISRRFGKKWPAFTGALMLGLMGIPLYPLLPPGNLWAAIFFASILGGFVAGAIVIFDSLVADVVDHDELMTGKNRDGLYFGCWMMATKFARATAFASTGLILGWAGLEEGVAQQAEGVGWRIALVFGPGVGICFVFAALAFAFFPLTDAYHARVQALLTRRRRHRSRDKD
mgnify:CR=1 FL=1